MQKLANFVPTLSHHLKPLMRDGSQFTCMLFHPGIDGGIALDSAVESQQVRSHGRARFCFLGFIDSRGVAILIDKLRACIL